VSMRAGAEKPAITAPSVTIAFGYYRFGLYLEAYESVALLRPRAVGLNGLPTL
jgi:hypothetical protein